MAEGLQSDEINELTEKFDDPFGVSRQQVDFYRKTREKDLKTIRLADERNALIEGYSQKEHRVHKLSILAQLMENDLFGGFLWLDDVKGVGSGDVAQIVDFENFNASEVAQFRGVLDDIAKEMGGRVNRSELTGKDGGPIQTEDLSFLSDEERKKRIMAIIQAKENEK